MAFSKSLSSTEKENWLVTKETTLRILVVILQGDFSRPRQPYSYRKFRESCNLAWPVHSEHARS